MILGTGNIASVLKDRADILFFASGISDSSETRPSEFDRERQLLLAQDKNKHLVYFSSLSIYRDSNPYNEHKKKMERIVKANFNSYTIIRIEIISWGRNETTIHNVFRRKLGAGEPIEIRDTFRYIVNKDEFLYWLSLIPVGECSEMNIPGIRYSIKEILEMVKIGKL